MNVKKLNFDLAMLTRRCGEGAHATQAGRSLGLQMIADDLHEIYGAKTMQFAKNLAPKHVHALVARWKADGISDATIRNRMGWIRWWAEKVGKAKMLPADNAAYGLEARQRFKGNKAQELTRAVLERVGDRGVGLALQAERLFGLRREEALKMRPAEADKGNRLVLQASWCKGGRYREIPVWHPRQRQLLDEMRAYCGDGSVIGNGRNYRQGQKHYDNTILRAGIRNAHGYRHRWAQWLYKELTGWECPANGGKTLDQMTRAEEARDRRARFQISHEMGHGRIDVTDTYLGRRWAPKNRERAA